MVKERNTDKSLNTRILIVEDDPVNVFIIKSLFEKFKLTIEFIHAKNGSDAVDIFKKSTPDLIFMDLNLPIKDGLQASAEIRSFEGTNSHIPIIILSGEREQDLEDSNERNLIDEFVMKPLRFSKLQQIVDKYI